MNRPLTALLAALESLLVAGIGFGVLLVPLTALWAIQYELGIDWAVFYRAAADTWLLGHGVDIRFTLDPVVAAALGLPGAAEPFHVTIGALGIALLTALLAVRAGGRLFETDHRRLAAVTAIAVFGLLSLVLALTAGTPAAQPSRWQGVVLPLAVFVAGLAVGWHRRRGVPLRNPLLRLPIAPGWAVLLGEGARAGVAAIAGLLAAASVAVAVLLVLGYATVVSLYEALQGDVLGGAVLTLGQLALLPDLVIWAAAWLTGPGFSLGAGSSVSPLGTALGPVPGLPVLGALPAGDLAFGFLGLAVPLAVAFLCGALLRPRLDRTLLLPPAVPELLAAAGAAGVAGGVVLGLLCWAASGAAGPGRLASVGPDPLLVGVVVALEVAVAVALGLLTAGRRSASVGSGTASLSEELRR
ncbi:DUF6350 family protein [Naasia sp. SYSU D00948]|uniref:cell division protein PerM n=1 Tax=Naasia sp. SYSU D00948 TaxID=2817379 RepID=UPI001B301FE5|nr:DUF6350 family protein [Naasia sp. SYSU D00948]